MTANKASDTMAVEQLDSFKHDIPNLCWYAPGVFCDFMSSSDNTTDVDYHHSNAVSMIGEIIDWCLLDEDRAARFLTMIKEQFPYVYKDLTEQGPKGKPRKSLTHFC